MEPVIAAFRRAAAGAPAYRRLLEEHGTRPDSIVDLETFTTHCPILTKTNTFDRFPIGALCVGGAIRDLAGVLTSSGHGGRFSFGLTTRRQHREGATMIDAALDAAFQVTSRDTLVINCLPMGVGFSSNVTTVATTSVREDMVTALVQTFGHYYEQLVIVSDPLFVKCLLDHAAAERLDWRRHRLGVILGEELFGEHFRSYAARALGLDADDPGRGYIMSSFGVGELGLHLGYETPATIALRRAAFRDPALARDLFGDPPLLPMVLAYDAQRTLIEAIDADGAGYGRMTISMLDLDAAVPLLRYQTGDVVKLLDGAHVARVLERHGVRPDRLPDACLALAGREKERLPDGSHVGVYKDALYADPEIADRITGAFRVSVAAGGFLIVHVQLAKGVELHGGLEARMRSVLDLEPHRSHVVVTSYDAFPFGVTLDYERKFSYYVPGESALAV